MFVNHPVNRPKTTKNLGRWAGFNISLTAGLVSEAPGDKGQVPPRQCWTEGSRSPGHGGGRRKAEAASRQRLGLARPRAAVADADPASRRPPPVAACSITGAAEAGAAPGQHVPSRDPPGCDCLGAAGLGDLAAGAAQAAVARSVGRPGRRTVREAPHADRRWGGRASAAPGRVNPGRVPCCLLTVDTRSFRRQCPLPRVCASRQGLWGAGRWPAYEGDGEVSRQPWTPA